jgi:hypothetical protein
VSAGPSAPCPPDRPRPVRRPVRPVRPDIRIARPVREYRDPFGVPYEPDGQVLSYRVSACPDTAFQLASRPALVCFCPSLSAPGKPGDSPSRPAGVGAPGGHARRLRRSMCASPPNQHTLPDARVAARTGCATPCRAADPRDRVPASGVRLSPTRLLTPPSGGRTGSTHFSPRLPSRGATFAGRGRASCLAELPACDALAPLRHP